MPSELVPFAGEETFAATPARVFAVVTDVDALTAAMPGRTSAERVDERTARAVVRPGFSFLAGQIRLLVEVTEADPPRTAVIRTSAQGIGLSMGIESRLSLAPTAAGGTRVAWEARVSEMKGLVSAVPAGLIRGAAQKVIDDGWRALRGRIEGA